MLAFANVMYFLADELARLRTRGFPLTSVPRGPPLRCFLRHRVPQ